jgi:hypothetical protein
MKPKTGLVLEGTNLRKEWAKIDIIDNSR